MSEWTKEQIDALGSEWARGGQFVLGDDLDRKDRLEIEHWIAHFIVESVGENDSERGYILSLIYHSLNFDIPFEATRGVREDLLRIIRAKRRIERNGG